MDAPQAHACPSFKDSKTFHLNQVNPRKRTTKKKDINKTDLEVCEKIKGANDSMREQILMIFVDINVLFKDFGPIKVLFLKIVYSCSAVTSFPKKPNES